MADVQNEILEEKNSPSFIGLQAYSEEQSNFFFGRDAEISALTTLIKSNTLTIVFGKSGTGKTSLLNAGVFPKLRKDYCLPFRIRLEFSEGSPDLLTQVKNVLREEIEKYGFKVESYPGSETLWEYFHKESLWRSLTPILVFDQFEEIFTLAKKNPEFAREQLGDFWEELSDLIENEIPDKLSDIFLNHREQITYNYKRQPVKVVFAFREEFLPEFESIPTNIPSLKYSRFRLMPMNEDQAYDVITKTWKEKIEPQQARKIITYFTANEKLTYLSEIEPSLLSQVCFYLDKERIAKGKNKITSAFLGDYPKETILPTIYNEVLAESYDAVGHPAGSNSNVTSYNPVKVFVEDKLITDEGYRIKYALTGQDEPIKPGIEVLKSKYFVRDDGKAVELTHDVLTPFIKADRENRRKVLATTAARKKANRRALIVVILGLIVAALSWFFITRQAYAEEKAAKDRKATIDKQLVADSASLAGIKVSIQAAQKSLDSLRERGKGGLIPPNITRDTSDGDSLNRAIAELENRILVLNNQKLSLENDITLLHTQVQQLTSDLGNLTSENNTLRVNNGNLQAEIATNNDNIAKWRRMFEDLKKEFDAYRLLYPKTFPQPLPGEGNGNRNNLPYEEVADTNSLKLNLYYRMGNGKSSPVRPNFSVYIIPYSGQNRKIINDAKLYEIRCDERKLRRAEGFRLAEYRNGRYVFPDLPKGKYFIKICTYYGGFYDYTKTKTGTDSLRLDASPPIR